MKKQETLDRLERLRKVVELLPEDAEIYDASVNSVHAPIHQNAVSRNAIKVSTCFSSSDCVYWEAERVTHIHSASAAVRSVSPDGGFTSASKQRGQKVQHFIIAVKRIDLCRGRRILGFFRQF